MRFTSVHLYGEDVQLIQLGNEKKEAIIRLLEIMEDVVFYFDEDRVVMFMSEEGSEESIPVFSFEEYLHDSEKALQEYRLLTKEVS